MSNLTLSEALPKAPELDRPDADEIGDDILLESAAKIRTAKVRGGTIASERQSAESRAWTSSGRVD
jgi:hypothetical protein